MPEKIFKQCSKKEFCVNPFAIEDGYARFDCFSLDKYTIDKKKNYCKDCHYFYYNSRIKAKFQKMVDCNRKRCAGFISYKQLCLLYEIQNKQCPFFEHDLDATNISIEHIHPVTLGGTNHINNLILDDKIVNYAKNKNHFRVICAVLGKDYIKFKKRVSKIHKEYKKAVLLLFCCSLFGVEYNPDIETIDNKHYN